MRVSFLTRLQGQHAYRTKTEQAIRGDGSMLESVEALRAREDEVGREWKWLHDALNTVARARAEQGDAAAFRLMQQQAMRVGQRRAELRLAMSQLERSGR